MITNPIFIVGTGRCGTHWLGRWLRSHPDCYGSAESHLFSIMAPLLDMDWNQGLKTWLDVDDILAAIRDFANATLGQCVSRKPSETRLVEYSWCHFDCIAFIQKIYPDAKFVHIYRDGRNVVESWTRTNTMYTADRVVDMWCDTMQAMLDMANDSVMHIKYEELIEQPKLSSRITEFLGLDHHKDIDNWKYPVNTPNYSYDPNRWQQLSSDVQAKLAKMNPLLERLGYYPSLPRMDREQVLEQLAKIAPIMNPTNWVIVGSAAMVLQGRKADCKDIDVVQLTDEPLVLDSEYKANPTSRFYRDFRLDVHYGGDPQTATELYGNAAKVTPALSHVCRTHSTTVNGYTVMTPEGFELVHWLLHYHEWQPKSLKEHGYTAKRPTGDDKQKLLAVMGEELFDFVDSRAADAARNSQSAHLYKGYEQ